MAFAITRKCSVNETFFKTEMEFADVSWTLDFDDVTSDFEPGSVLMFACKHSSIKFKHYCSPSTGQWDVKPGSEMSCQAINTCPNLEETFDLRWNWICTNQWFSESTCIGSCRTNSTLTKNVKCDSESNQWRELDESEQICSPIQCQDNWQTFNETSYCYVNHVHTFDNATQICKDMNSKLFEPKDISTNDQVWEVVAKKGITWIGIHDKIKEGR